MKIQLRPWTQSSADIESLLKYADNAAIAANMTDGFPHPFHHEAAQVFLQRVASAEPPRTLAIDYNGEAIGAVGLHLQGDIYCKNAELGYWLAESFWGKGLMTQAVQQIVAYGFEKFPINRIYARPFGRNIGSQKVLEKAGFKLEAQMEKTIFKKGVYEDELIYAVRRPS